MSGRVPYLDGLRGKNILAQFYDPDGERYGLPTYPYHWAPDGLLTIRQLRAKGLRPGGQDIAAQILWRHRKQRASPTSTAKTSPNPNGAPPSNQLAAIGKALRARRICPTCGSEKPYCIPRSRGECNDCASRWENAS